MVDARAAAHMTAAKVYGKKIRRLEERITELEDLMRDLTDPEECSLDHEGCCQTHNWNAEVRCPHDRAKELLAAAPPPQSSEVDPLDCQHAALPEETTPDA